MRALSPRIKLLLERFRTRYAELGTRLYAEPEEAAVFGRLLLQSYQGSFGQPSILRRAAALETFAAQFPVQVAPYELFVGRQTFNPPWSARDFPAEALGQLGYAGTTGHIVHDYAALLHKGINGLKRELAQARQRATSAEQALAVLAFERALSAFGHFVQRHADAAEELAGQLAAGRASEWWTRAGNLLIIAQHPPQSFNQALQLVWLAQIFLHAENPSMAISFGRLDQCLWPYLERDLQAGRLSEHEAFDRVCAFCLKCCEGEESQNLTLGGVDAEGQEQANPLSVLFVEAIEALGCHQPSLTVRRRPGAGSEPGSSPHALHQTACRLAASGSGQPGFMNDTVVAQALQAVGLPADRARDWGIVGCYEATPQGDCYPNTVLGSLHLPAALAEYLSAAQATDFEAFVEGFHQHLQGVYAQELQRLQQTWNHFREQAPSPFGSLLLGGCLEHILPLEAGAGRFNLVGIDIQGLGTLVDSLHAIRALVFDRQRLTLAELAQAVGEDFPDEALRRELRHLPGRFGSDDPATNELAAQVSERLAKMVLDSRLEGGVRPYPGFFRFGGDIHDLRVASPDGRRQTDFISYGCGPAAGVAPSPTAAMRATAHVAHRLCGCGNPLAISLPQPALPVEEGARLIGELVDTYFSLGGFHVHFNTPSAADLREAQAHPEQHGDLMVRVSGFSARFVRMDEQWQKALIERAEE